MICVSRLYGIALELGCENWDGVMLLKNGHTCLSQASESPKVRLSLSLSFLFLFSFWWHLGNMNLRWKTHVRVNLIPKYQRILLCPLLSTKVWNRIFFFFLCSPWESMSFLLVQFWTANFSLEILTLWQTSLFSITLGEDLSCVSYHPHPPSPTVDPEHWNEI